MQIWFDWSPIYNGNAGEGLHPPLIGLSPSTTPPKAGFITAMGGVVGVYSLAMEINPFLIAITTA